MMMSKLLRRFFFSFVATLALSAVASASQPDADSLQQFCNSVAEGAYALAWPSATYRTWGFQNLATGPDEVDLTIRLYGQSAFDDSDLWTDVTFYFGNGRLRDIRWGANNAILFPPGATMGAMRDAAMRWERDYEVAQGNR
jgi:hypothetical protein